MANAYKYAGPKKTQNCIGPDPSGPGASLVSGERVGKAIPSVDQIAEASADAGLWKGAWKEMSESERDVIRQRAEGVHAMLEERLGPLLRAGQAMADDLFGEWGTASDEAVAWQVALAALGREK